MRQHRGLFVMLFLAFGLLTDAVAAECGANCRDRSQAFGWTKKVTAACIKGCRRDQRQCRGLKGAARRDCRDDSADCSLQCGEVWSAGGLQKDRTFCQTVCGSCGRSSRGFCVEGLGSSADDVARCCGGPGEGECCRSLASPVTAQCCAEANTCCPTSGCVDTQNDPNNCGGCGAPCPTGETCEAGICSGQKCCPKRCTDTASPNAGIRTIKWRQLVSSSGGSYTTEVIGLYDPCGATDEFGNCIVGVTLICKTNGVEYTCGAFESAIYQGSIAQALLGAGAYCAFGALGGLCVVDGRPCSMTSSGDDQTVEQSYTCSNCGEYGPACAAEMWAGCSCPHGGFPECPPPCMGRPCP